MAQNIHTRFTEEINDQLSELFRTWAHLDNYAASFSYENEAANERAERAAKLYDDALDLAINGATVEAVQ